MPELDQDQLFDPPIGERLKAAREAKGMTLADVAGTTRVPIRHLEYIERGEWDELPAITYAVGFARSYANAVGLDGPAIGAEVREQLGSAPRATALPANYYEPADPSRVPPRPLALGAALLALLLAIAVAVWRSGALDGTSVEESMTAQAPAADFQAAPQAAAPPAPAIPAGGPVVLTATADAWIRITDGGSRLFEGVLKAGERYEVPATAVAPEIRTGIPEGLWVTVGGVAVPPLGAPSTIISNASLRAADLAARAQPGRAQQP